MYFKRGLCQERCLKLLNFLIQPRTISDICEHLEITHRAAQDWIQSASLHWPIVESGKRYPEHGRPAIEYQLTLKLIPNGDYHANNI